MTTTNATRPAIWPRIRDFLVYVIGQVRTIKKPYPGIMHLFIFWGMIIQVIGTAIKLMQMGLFVPFTWPLFSPNVYYAYELVMDLAGIAVIAKVRRLPVGWCRRNRAVVPVGAKQPAGVVEHVRAPAKSFVPTPRGR